MKTIKAAGDHVAKGGAARALVRELLMSSEISAPAKTVKNFLKHVSEGAGEHLLAVDLDEVFRFVLFGRHLLVIPRPRFEGRDLLVLRNFQGRIDVELEKIEFRDGGFEINPNVYLAGYLRECLRRGLYREAED